MLSMWLGPEDLTPATRREMERRQTASETATNEMIRERLRGGGKGWLGRWKGGEGGRGKGQGGKPLLSGGGRGEGRLAMEREAEGGLLVEGEGEGSGRVREALCLLCRRVARGGKSRAGRVG